MPRILALAIVALLIPASLMAQDATEEAATTETYTDSRITFDYPADWVLDAAADTTGSTIALGNTPTAVDAVSFAAFAEGDVQVLVVREADPFFANRLGIPLDADLPPELALNLVLPEEIPVEALTFDDGREAAEVIFADEDAGTNTLIWLVELGQGARGALLITGRTADVEALEPELLSIAESLTLSPIVITGVSENGVELGEVFVNSQETHRMQYPAGWLVAENQRNVIFFATSGEALDTQNLADLARGEVVGLLYLSVDLIPEYPAGDTTPDPLAVVSFFAELGTSVGYEQVGETTSLQFDGAAGAVSVAANTAQAHERLVLAVDTGEGVSTMLAYTDLGSMDVARPVLEAMLASVEAGDFTAAATQEASE